MNTKPISGKNGGVVNVSQVEVLEIRLKAGQKPVRILSLDQDVKDCIAHKDSFRKADIAMSFSSNDQVRLEFGNTMIEISYTELISRI